MVKLSVLLCIKYSSAQQAFVAKKGDMKHAEAGMKGGVKDKILRRLHALPE